MSRPDPPAGPVPGLILLAVIWGANFAVIKAVLERVPPMGFNALRFPLAAAVLLGSLVALGRVALPARDDLAGVVALGLVGNVAYQGLFIHGIDLTTAGNASLLLATSPVWTAILTTAVGHERLAPRVWIGIGITVVGMLFVVAGGAGLSFGTATLRGDLMMIGSAATWAIYTVGSRPLVQRYGPLEVTSWTLWVGTPVLVVLGIPDLRSLDWSGLEPVHWIGVVYAGVLAISVAYLLWNRGVRHIGSARTAAYSNLVPVVALLTAWMTLGERPTPLQVLGTAAILAGVTTTRSGRTRAPSGAVLPETRTGGSPRA